MVVVPSSVRFLQRHHLNTFVCSQLLDRKYSGNFFVNLLGKWKESEYSGQSVPVGGLAYYITAPSR